MIIDQLHKYLYSLVAVHEASPVVEVTLRNEL
jgi:hypothetical protein